MKQLTLEIKYSEKYMLKYILTKKTNYNNYLRMQIPLMMVELNLKDLKLLSKKLLKRSVKMILTDL